MIAALKTLFKTAPVPALKAHLPSIPDIESMEGQSLLAQVVATQLSGLSGGIYSKMESPPDKAPLYSAVDNLLDRFSKHALPHLLKHLRSTTRCGDYNDSTSYPDVDGVMRIVMDKGLGSEMVSTLLGKDGNISWSPHTMVAVQALRDSRTTNALLAYMLTSGSERSTLSHYSRKDTVADYVLGCLSLIANKDRSSKTQVYLEFCDFLPGLASGGRGFDKKGMALFAEGLCSELKAKAVINDQDCGRIKNALLSNALSSQEGLLIADLISKRSIGLSSEIRSSLELASIVHGLLDPGLTPAQYELNKNRLSAIKDQSKEAQDLAVMLGRLEQGIRSFPEFELASTLIKFLPAAYKIFKSGKVFEVRKNEAKYDRFFSQEPSTKDDPSAALMPGSSYGSSAYYRMQPKNKLVEPASLKLEVV